MKKITLLVLLFVSSLQAQTYCSINEDFIDVEEITSVNFATISIINTNTTDIYVDYTATVADVVTGKNLTLVVKGDTKGDFNSELVAYIDWNQNGSFNDDGEMFYIGLLTDSSGYDAKFASAEISVPSTATLGTTRIRVMKVFTEPSDYLLLNNDACSISNDFFGEIYGTSGQALDFTLNISNLNRDAFENNAFILYPNPTSDVLKIDTNESIDALSIFNLQGQLVLECKSTKELNVQNLATGTYFLKISSGNLSQVKKFVKN